ncbi:MAG: class I SAM-dependent methyltransferase [Bryobacteraceae bacterium]|nr:class I SAM-dependent methyltransferase [Bryobacteraceae bacterium]
MSRDISVEAYTQLADRYAVLAPTKAHNAYYDRPATLGLLGHVVGLEVLDCGTGTGEYAAALAGKGARVTGLDNCPAMLLHARNRVPRALFLCASLDGPLPFQDGRFDAIAGGLVFDYVRHWDPMFVELYRVLRPGGWLVFSIEHPASAFRLRVQEAYHAVERQMLPWRGFGTRVNMVSWRRPLQDVLRPPLGAGFVLDEVLEPLPTEEMRHSDPRHFAELHREPGFLCLRYRKLK